MKSVSFSQIPLLTGQRQRRWILPGLLLLVGLYWSLTFREGHGWGGDFSLYIHHAINLLNGFPYGDTGYILNPAVPIVSPQNYPPVFPLLLAPVIFLFGLNLTALKMVVVVCFVLFLAVFTALIKRELPLLYLCAVIIVLGFNPYLWDFKDDIRSDIPFLLFVYVALYLIYHVPPHKRQERGAVAPAILTGLFFYLAYGTRTAGIVLPACLVGLDLLQQRKITRFTLVAELVIALGIIGQKLLFPSTDYAAQYTFDPAANLGHIIPYVKSTSVLWDNGYNDGVLLVISLVALASAATAVWLRLRSRPTILELFAFAYALVLVLWPVSQGIRFLIPIVPLFVFYTFYGIWQWGKWLPGNWSARLFWGVTAVILLSYGAKYTTLSFGALPSGVNQPESTALFEFVKEQTAETAVIIFRKPRVLALYTGRASAIYNPEDSEAEQWAFWREIGATYAIVSQWDEPHWQEFINRHPADFQLVYTNADFRVYRIKAFPNSNEQRAEKNGRASLPLNHDTPTQKKPVAEGYGSQVKS